ncbi:MAG: ATP phosphoribosyltransferase [Bacteroidetes bacterium]|nr:MAG: ATP phosphoribosyltransferase [Bacteroidota bacterium]
MNIKVAIQSKGRLSEKSLALFRECGIRFENGKGNLKMTATNFPLEILLLRDDDIPEYVESGVADLGIVGQNVVWEKTENVKELKNLGFGKCRLSLAVDKNFDYRSIQDINGFEIATSYPNILRKHLNENNIKAKIHKISGSVEIAPGIGLANAVCDIVSTGSTLTLNGLKEVDVILKSQAVLIVSPNLLSEKQLILDKLSFRLDAVQKAKNNKYILLNVPNDKIDVISNILPGMKSPTVVPLAEEGWSSVHSVVNENEFWDVIEKLRDNGAQGILVMPIEKMII